MFVLIKCDTWYEGCSSTEVYEFADGTDEEALDAYANELAREDAEMYGIFDDEQEACDEAGIEFNESDCYSYSYEILKDMTREEIEEQYGEILSA